MPIAITMIEGESDTERQKAKARLIVLFLNVVFYALTFTWFFLSAFTGNFIIRFSISMMFCFLTVVFLISLLRIKSLI